MPIKLPKKRAYYLASQNEPDRLMCWIPLNELEDIVKNGAKEELTSDFPEGLEIEITDEEIKNYKAEYKLDLKIKPKRIKSIFSNLYRKNLLPASCIVDGSTLESLADQNIDSTLGDSNLTRSQRKAHRKSLKPEWTEGEDPKLFMYYLSK